MLRIIPNLFKILYKEAANNPQRNAAEKIKDLIIIGDARCDLKDGHEFVRTMCEIASDSKPSPYDRVFLLERVYDYFNSDRSSRAQGSIVTGYLEVAYRELAKIEPERALLLESRFIKSHGGHLNALFPAHLLYLKKSIRHCEQRLPDKN